MKVSQQVDVRLQIRNAARDRMIQVQNGRFSYNWLGVASVEYPLYESVRPEFDEHWEKFCEFVISCSEKSFVQPNQWEVIYVNHMPQGTVWEKLSELPEVLTFLRQPMLNDLSLSPKALGGE